MTGNPGNGFEFSGRGSFTGTDTKVAYPAGVGATDFAQVKLTILATGGSLTGTYELLDENGGTLGTGTVGTVTPTAGSAMALALAGAAGAAVPGLRDLLDRLRKRGNLHGERRKPLAEGRHR